MALLIGFLVLVYLVVVFTAEDARIAKRKLRRAADCYHLRTWQVTYVGCTSNRGPCGATENSHYPAPLFCRHHGIKTEVK